MAEKEYRLGSHTVYDIKYHVVWVTKYRYRVLAGETALRAREVIRQVQEARKGDGLDVSDRIRLWWRTADPELSAALTEHGDLIASEVLAVEFSTVEPGDEGPGDAIGHADGDLGLEFWLRRVR